MEDAVFFGGVDFFCTVDFLALVFFADDVLDAVAVLLRTRSVWPAITREPLIPLSDLSRATVVP